jgi:hypothetical protein
MSFSYDEYFEPLFFKSLKVNGVITLKYGLIGLWYEKKKQSLLNTKKTHYKTMLSMMLLTHPKPWIPHELWNLVFQEIMMCKDPIYILLTQNGSNEIVKADLEKLF